MKGRSAFARRGLALACGAWCGMACAVTVTVGRASTQLPDDQRWVSHALPAGGISITGGLDGQIRTASTALWLMSARGTVDAVLVLRGTGGGYAGAVRWVNSCEHVKPSAVIFVRDRWRNLVRESWDDCVTAAGPLDLARALRASHAAVADAMRDKGVELTGLGYVVRANVANGNSSLNAALYVVQSFKGSDGRIDVDLGPAKIPPAVAQWGADLSAALLSSTRSLSGSFALPRIDVAAAAPRTEAPPATVRTEPPPAAPRTEPPRPEARRASAPPLQPVGSAD